MKQILIVIGQNIRKLLQKTRSLFTKVKMPEKEASRDWISERADGAGSIFKRSTRRFSHYAIMFIFIIVIAVGVFTRPTNEKKKEDPYLFGYTDEQVNEVTYVQSVATIGGIVDEKIGQQAYEVASKKDMAPVLAVSGDSFIAKPTLSEARSTENKPKNDIREYIVQDGDTLSTIAAKFDLTSSSLKWANGIEDADSVKPGQKLIIPPTIGVLYVVQECDSLGSI